MDDSPRAGGASAGTIPDHVERLRAELAKRGLDGFMIPRADEHQGEYVPPCAERLAWISGFTGSAGLAIVTSDKAALFVDGRYTIQARDEAPATVFEHCHLLEQPATDWIAANLNKGDKLGFDPRLTTPNQTVRYRKAVMRAGAELVAVPDNPLDTAWNDRPSAPQAPVRPHDIAFAGRTHRDKCETLAGKLTAQSQNAMVIAEPDCIAWLLNVRGGDLAYLPQPLSFAVLNDDASVDWFVDPAKADDGLGQHLGPDVSMLPPERFEDTLRGLGAAGANVRIDPDSCSEWIRTTLTDAGASVAFGPDLCLAERAAKTPAEVDGMRHAHIRDGAALVRFLAWLDQKAPSGNVTEIGAADYLETCRRDGEHFRGLSFPTISGSGPNGAIVHYRVTPETDRKLEPGDLYLVDSGAQYLDGTTDVTRTVAIGEPTGEMRSAFTRVLKGHIAVATARFPKGTSGSQIDPFARRALWEAGLDYDHGTGHGVGSYLSVHEGPQRIAKAPNTVALVPGMVVSNEPGYYRTGAFGIRIENLVLVTDLDPPPVGAERHLLCFETLTLAPIDRRLVVSEMLDGSELDWLNAYHVSVREQLTPLLDAETAAWLAEATLPL
ncbi:MAG: aminopeptidase P family protein [Rhodospirillales bacterium]